MDDSFGRELMRLHETAAQLVRRDSGLAEIFAERTFRDHLRLSFRSGEGPREHYREEVTIGTGLRSLSGGCTRSAAVDSYRPEDVADAAAGLGLERGLLSESSPSVRGEWIVPQDAPDVVSKDEKRELLRAAADAAFSLRPSLQELDVAYQGRMRRVAVWASDMRPAQCASSDAGIRVRARVGDVVAEAIGGGAGGIGRFLHEPPETIAQRCVERLNVIAEASRQVRGRMPVVLRGGWGGAWLHEVIGHLLEADVAGPFDEASLGTPVAPSTVTIVDDGTFADGRGSSPFDDEGLAAQRTVLVDKGVLVGLMTDREAAATTGLPRTGNGRRQDYRHEPMPRMTNLFLEAGTADPEALILDVDHGLYVSTVGRGHVRPSEDTAWLEVLDGYRIEHGRLTESVAGLRLRTRPSRMLRNITAVANDFDVDPARGVCVKQGQSLPVSAGMPSVLIADLEVEPAR